MILLSVFFICRKRQIKIILSIGFILIGLTFFYIMFINGSQNGFVLNGETSLSKEKFTLSSLMEKMLAHSTFTKVI